jgi:DDE superfamily endonuclease
VLNALVLLYFQTVRQPTSTDPIPDEIQQNTKFWPYFKDCIGAIDGTHIYIYIPTAEQAAWRNRKGFISQNVFAACSFDLQFIFIHAGWQGSAHDALVLKDAIVKQRFRPPANRYYVADTGFYNCDFMLIPYAKTRYHLREYVKAQLRPNTKEELFNLRYA